MEDGTVLVSLLWVVSCGTHCLPQSLVLTIPSSDIEKQQQLSDGPHASVHKVRLTSLLLACPITLHQVFSDVGCSVWCAGEVFLDVGLQCVVCW